MEGTDLEFGLPFELVSQGNFGAILRQDQSDFQNQSLIFEDTSMQIWQEARKAAWCYEDMHPMKYPYLEI